MSTNNGIGRNALKLIKVSSAQDLDDIKKAFNYNMDQIMAFGGGEQGEQGEPGSIGDQGDQGYSLYGNSDIPTRDEDVLSFIEDEETSEGAADFVVNRKGLYKVTRDTDGSGLRNVKMLFAWKEEDSDGTPGSYIFPTQETQDTPTNEQLWKFDGAYGGVTPENDKSVVLCGDATKDKSWYRAVINSPLSFYQDGSVAFINMQDASKVQAYTVSAAYSERGSDPNMPSGLLLGQSVDTTVANATPKSLPHTYIQYVMYSDKSTSNFMYHNGTVACKSVITENTDSINVVQYSDKGDAENKIGLEQTTIVKNIGSTGTVTITSMAGNMMRVEGIIPPGHFTLNIGKSADRIVAPKTSSLVYGHVVNSYGPEHIEFYGCNASEVGLGSADAYTDAQGLWIDIDATPLTKPTSLFTTHNNEKAYINLLIKLPL